MDPRALMYEGEPCVYQDFHRSEHSSWNVEADGVEAMLGFKTHSSRYHMVTVDACRLADRMKRYWETGGFC